VSPGTFTEVIKTRQESLRHQHVWGEFIREMQRFMPPKIVTETVENRDFWNYLARVIEEESLPAIRAVEMKNGDCPHFY